MVTKTVVQPNTAYPPASGNIVARIAHRQLWSAEHLKYRACNLQEILLISQNQMHIQSTTAAQWIVFLHSAHPVHF